MKNIKNALLLVLTTLMVTGCAGNGGGGGNKDDDDPIVEGKYIVQNSYSDYRIVVPENILAYVDTAQSELSYFLVQSTGVKLSVVTDTEVTSGYNYISLGGTRQFLETFGEETLDPIKGSYSGYFISTKNDNIYICSDLYGYGAGTLYGVYDLLEDLVGYHYYYDDAIEYETLKNVSLYNYADKIVTPSFDERAVGTYEMTYNNDIMQRLRYINMYRGREICNQLYGHGQIRCFMNPLKDTDENGVLLGVSHPDWFMNPSAGTTGNQICYTGGDEEVAYVAKKMIGYLQKNPDAEYFMFGQEDNTRMCSCDRCRAAMAEWGYNSSGLQVHFMNEVIKICDEWLAENAPTRIVKYLIYAYYASKYAPVKEENGKWVPYSDKVIPDEKLCIFYAPIECNFSFPINSPENSELYLVLQQWGAITNNIVMYLYDVNFHNYFVNFNNFGTVKEMYQTCKDNGCSFMYSQGAMDTVTTCLAEMRAYTESRLMWNLDLDYDTVAHDFMNHFYEDGGECIYDYYQLIRDAYARYIGEHASAGSIYGSIATSSLWTSSLVRKMDGKIHEALSAIDKYAISDYSHYSTLKNRIMREYLSVIYLKVTLYRSYYTDEEIAEMKEIFEHYTSVLGISASSEGGSLDGIF